MSNRRFVIGDAAEAAGLEILDDLEEDIDMLLAELAQFQKLVVDLKDKYEQVLTVDEWISAGRTRLGD